MSQSPIGSSLPLNAPEIVAHYRAGTLLPELQKPLDTRGQELLHERLAALHNAGDIDMLALAALPDFQNAAQSRVYSIHQLYYSLIPRLEAPAPAMVELLKRLIAQGGGNSSAANVPRVALCQWIAKDPERARAIVAAARADPDVDLEILHAALVTLDDTDTVKEFLTIIDARRQAAIAALGVIHPQSDAVGRESLTALLLIATSDPIENIRLTALMAGFNLLSRHRTEAAMFVKQFVKAVEDNPSEQTRIALLQSIWHHTALFDSPSAKAVLSIALSGDLSSPGLSGSFDAALAHLIDSDHCTLAIDVLAAVLTSDEARARGLDNLQGIEHRLMALDPEKLFSLAVRWFETGDPTLCEAVARVITRRDRARPFDATLAPFALTGERQVVLCHKAIAYLLFQPTVAASFLVAALRATDKTTEPKLIDALFETLLINYGDTVARYLKTVSAGDVAYRGVRKSLRLYRAYQKGLVTEAAPIKELLPSASQRASVGQKSYALGKEIRKQAHRESVLSRLVHRSTLLYGRKSLIYAAGADNPPVSLEMRTIRAGLEMPRLEVIDPVGLDFLIRIFRTSQAK